MIDVNLCLFGGRGASSNSGKGGGSASGSGNSSGDSNRETFSSLSEFENSLTGLDDARLAEYSNALEEGTQRVNEINNLQNFASNEGLAEWTRLSLENERRQAQDRLNNMPQNKTPAKFGESQGLNDVINSIDRILSITPSGRRPSDDVSILV